MKKKKKGKEKEGPMHANNMCPKQPRRRTTSSMKEVGIKKAHLKHCKCYEIVCTGLAKIRDASCLPKLRAVGRTGEYAMAIKQVKKI